MRNGIGQCLQLILQRLHALNGLPNGLEDKKGWVKKRQRSQIQAHLDDLRGTRHRGSYEGGCIRLRNILESRSSWLYAGMFTFELSAICRAVPSVNLGSRRRTSRMKKGSDKQIP